MKMDVPNNVDLRTLIKLRQLTLGDVAEALGVSGVAVSYWQRGQGRIDESFHEPLAKVLGVSVSDIRKVIARIVPVPKSHTRRPRQRVARSK